ncbi:FAD/NAD(P)-binding domain-containing protein [Coemansia reversa NRRL 1564]|uniref:FAD/NAD(P)-binding domain-containing protein n=1 Tax=Coemansia reversa (strain ATCC 12441 / NRRL 1564) TaxID=763665 RepID=A0A2G5BGC4_COERN|nr:FAD/NAD(P)-binding domain-containing protein [Coemansia reversa NRRL 1564]|eukprot:PIA18060.1 FAD/NAD(P)-binding domain-containing protein [Coemansia reversa NRRL 1564]
MPPTGNPIRIAVAGGNYGGLGTIKNLYLNLLATNPDYDGTKQAPPNPNVNITLIDRRDGFVHYMGMTRGITNPQYGSQLWVPYTDMPWLQHPSIAIRKNIISRITPAHIEFADSSERLEFDYLVLAMGLSRNAPIGVAASTEREYLDSISRYHKLIQDSKSIAVVGGGAVGTEMAADLKSDYPEKDVVLIHSHQLPVQGPFMNEFRHEVVKVLDKLGIRTIFGERVIDETAVKDDFSLEHVKHSAILPELIDSVKRKATLITSSGNKVEADLIFSSNGIRVNKSMQIDDPNYPHIFAVGDISNHAVVKYAKTAIRNGSVAGTNIVKLINSNGKSVKLDEMSNRGGRGRRGRGERIISTGVTTGTTEYSQIKLELGEQYCVIQSEDGVVPSDFASSMSSPDIKISRAKQNLAVGSYPKFGR